MRYKIPLIPFYGVMLFATTPVKKRKSRKPKYEIDTY
jgi:hypothetical protein